MPIDTYPAPVQSTPGAVLGYAQTTAPQTGISTTAVDLAGLAVTVTVPVGRTIRIRGQVMFANQAAGANYTALGIAEGAALLNDAVANFGATGSNQMYGSATVEVIVTPSAGVHTYKLTASATVASVNTLATAARMPFIVVEDITGGTGGPGPIQLAYAPMTVASQTFSAAADVTGATLTITVPAGRTIRLSGSAICQCDGTAGRAVIHIQEGATKVGRVVTEELVASAYVYASNSVIISPSAGTHTYRLVGVKETGAGIFTIVSDSQYPAYINAEDITGTPAPGGLLPSSQTLAYAEVTANQGSITTEADLTGLSVTITVPAGRRLRITGHTYPNSTVALDDTLLRIKEGATQLTQASLTYATTVRAEFLDVSIIVTPSAGTHTYKLSMQRSAGTGTVTNNASTTFPSYILVEDITGGALPVPAASVPVGQLGYAQVTSGQGSITTQTDLTGLSVNVTVPAGRMLRITGKSRFTHTVANSDTTLIVLRDGVQLGTQEMHNSTNTGQGNNIVAVVTDSPSAGAHVYKLAIAGDAGTITTYAATTEPNFILVEDITATPASATTAPSSTLAYAEVLANQNGITTEVDLTNLTVTVTVPAGRRLKVSGHTLPTSSVANDEVECYVYEGATKLASSSGSLGVVNGAASCDPVAIISPSAGTHTYKLRMARTIGTGSINMNAGAGYPAYLLVEDITAAAVPVISGAAQGFDVNAVLIADTSTAVSTWTNWGSPVSIPNPGFPIKILAHLTAFFQDFTTTTYFQTHLDISFDGGSTWTSGPDVNGVCGQGGSNINRMPLANTHFRSGQPTGTIVIQARCNSASTTGGFISGRISYMMVPA